MNQDIFKHYTILVDFLGNVLGQDYEISLVNLENNNNRIVAISNNHVTGNNVGDSLPTEMINTVKKQQDTFPDFVIDEPWHTNSISILRCSGLFVKDSNNEIVGLLMIIFDDSRYISLHDQLLSLAHPLNFLQNHSYHTIHHMEHFTSKENEPSKPAIATSDNSSNIHNLMDNMYRDAFIDTNLPHTRLTQEERIQVITRLKEFGFFKLKGSVPYAAKHLNCSSASIYRYLSDIKNK